MRSSKPKYSQTQNQELETKAFMVLAQTTQALSIPENELLGAVIAVGYRAINPDKPKRKTVDDILKLF